MSERIITKIKREKGLVYEVDKDGNVIERKWNWFKERTTLVVIVLIILGSLYYLQMSDSKTNEKNFDKYCAFYYPIRENFIINNPGIEPNFELVMKYYEDKLKLNNG